MKADSPEEICRLFQHAMSQGDIEGVLSLYEPDAVFRSQSGELKTGRALKDELGALASRKVSFEYEIRQVIHSGDIALMHTDWKIGADPRIYYALEVARKSRDGSWRWSIGDPYSVTRR
jgi:ketosteroid isomerase-like protein